MSILVKCLNGVAYLSRPESIPTEPETDNAGEGTRALQGLWL